MAEQSVLAASPTALQLPALEESSDSKSPSVPKRVSVNPVGKMNSEQFKKAGYDMIEYAAMYMETLHKRDPLPHVSPGWLKNLIPKSAPEKGERWEEILMDFEKVVMDGMAHWNHRQFFSYFPAGNSWASIMGDIFSNAVGTNGTCWDSCPVMTELEMIVMDWACKFLGLPDFFLSHFSNPTSEGGGTIQTSASDAILNSMISAREECVRALREKYPKKPRAVLLEAMVAYCSSQCHSCVEKGGMIGTMRIKQLPADENGGVRGATLRAAVREDMDHGLIPYFYCAILGSTGICAFDDLMELGPVCEEFGMWMHVDAAYAGSSFICPEMRYLTQGYEYAWSTNVNTNKWMLVNFDASLHFVRYRKKLIDAFTGYDSEIWSSPIYPVIHFKHFGLPSTRRFRAFKLWCVMRNYGVSGLQKYIRNHVYLAKLFERYVGRDERFEVVGPVRVGMTCFRLKGTNAINKKLLDALNMSRKIHMVPSAFHEKFVIRFAICAEDANEKDIDDAWRIISEFATATLHQEEQDSETAGSALKSLFEKQHKIDDFEKDHPDVSREEQIKDAVNIVKARVSDAIVDVADFVALDGSWSVSNNEQIKHFDVYVEEHPEMYQEKEILGEVKAIDKVSSMLRVEKLDIIEKSEIRKSMYKPT